MGSDLDFLILTPRFRKSRSDPGRSLIWERDLGIIHKLHVVARINRLSHIVDALRSLTIPGGRSAFGLGVDLALLVLTTTMLVTITARIYPRVVT